MNEQQKYISVVGSGYWGKNLVRNYYELGVLKSVCDTNPDTLSKFTAQYPGIQGLLALNDILQDDEIKGVVLATPAEWHESMVEQALEIFQELVADYSDLDDDGYAAVGVADCLAVLARDDQARAAYERVAETHPELAAKAKEQLVELELVGQITESLVVELRLAADLGGDNRFLANWQLGRALEKYAKALLDEAATAFRTAASLDDGRPRERST